MATLCHFLKYTFIQPSKLCSLYCDGIFSQRTFAIIEISSLEILPQECPNEKLDLGSKLVTTR